MLISSTPYLQHNWIHFTQLLISYYLDQKCDVPGDGLIVLAELFHLITGVHHRCVVTTPKRLTDLWEAVVGEFSR